MTSPFSGELSLLLISCLDLAALTVVWKMIGFVPRSMRSWLHLTGSEPWEGLEFRRYIIQLLAPRTTSSLSFKTPTPIKEASRYG